jgi:hypothetical protein
MRQPSTSLTSMARMAFKISGEPVPHEYGGQMVQGLGDVNGDDFADFIINAPGRSECYVVFGQASGFPASFDLATLNGVNGFKIKGYFTSVGSAGDVNGDGFDDIIAGVSERGFSTYDNDYPGFGASYVIYGKAGDFEAIIDGRAVDGTNGFRLSDAADSSSYSDGGGAVAKRAGDINGDGFDDLVIGAPFDRDYYRPSKAYVVFGRASFPGYVNLVALDSTSGFEMIGEGFSLMGGADDVNGDGFDDILLPNQVVFGKADGFPHLLDLATLDGSNGFTILGPYLQLLSSAGDLNGDGFSDLIVGDSRVYGAWKGDVIFAKPSGFSAVLNIPAFDGANGFRISGITLDETNGLSATGAGDINGDGYSDLIISAPFANADHSGAGICHLRQS